MTTAKGSPGAGDTAANTHPPQHGSSGTPVPYLAAAPCPGQGGQGGRL